MHNLDEEDPEGGAGSPGGADSLRDQVYCFITPVSTLFSYLIHSFSYLLENEPIIDYLYGTMPGIHDNIRARRPTLVD